MSCKKIFFVLILSTLCILTLMGCDKDKEDSVSIVYEFGDATVTYGEFYVYAQMIKEDYNKAYGEGIWGLEIETDEGKRTVKDVTICDIIDDINRIKVLNAQVEDLKISLGENEKQEAREMADEFYVGLTEKDIEEAELTKDIIVTVIQENMLAEKVYRQKLEEYDFEISEEEARMTSFYDMVFECYKVKKDGTVEEYSDEKKATQLEKANKAFSSLVQEEDLTYDEIVKKYNLKYASNYTMSKTELMNEYGESIANKILFLEDGEISTVIESQYGYHIFKMIKGNDKELTKKNKDEIMKKKQKEYFNEVYTDWLKDYDSHFDMEDVNMELVNKFSFVEEK